VKGERLHLLARWALITTSLSAILFLAAGTTHVTSIRRYLAVSSALLLVTILSVDSRLAHERAHPPCTTTDGELRLATACLFLLTLTVAAYSVGRLPARFNVPNPVRNASLLAFVLSSSLQTWAMIVNPFFSPVIRLQTEIGHHLIANGPYTFVRHPGYLAMLIAVPASATAIGSWIALLPACGFAAIIMRRTKIEDSFLLCSLPGYGTYANRVRRTLFPSLSSFQTTTTARRSVLNSPNGS
jgi:protein-S-isoprenylcysteine O-methyltransferase Ste14